MTSKLIDGWAEPDHPQHTWYTWAQHLALTSFIEDALDWEDRRLPESLLAECFVELRGE